MMNGTERRKQILQRLSAAEAPISGASLAGQFGVSRQVIVQDMALIRAMGVEILSTNRGYLLDQTLPRASRVIKVYHTDEQMREELYAIVDLGGCVDNVFVRHRVYGRIEAPLHLRSRRGVDAFLSEIKSGKSTPLKDVTSGYHYHTISADSEETLDLVEAELKRLGILLPRA